MNASTCSAYTYAYAIVVYSEIEETDRGNTSQSTKQMPSALVPLAAVLHARRPAKAALTMPKLVLPKMGALGGELQEAGGARSLEAAPCLGPAQGLPVPDVVAAVAAPVRPGPGLSNGSHLAEKPKAWLDIYIYICLSTSLSKYTYYRPSIYLSFYLSVSLSVIHLSIYLSVYTYIHTYIHT